MKIFLAIIVILIFTFLIAKLSNLKTTSTTSNSNTAQVSDTAGKLQVEDIKIGTGSAVKAGDDVVMEYTGTFPNGKVFDSTSIHGQPFETVIGVGKVIPGWDQGIPGMKVGGERKLVVPPNLGYGSTQVGSIPPNSTLIFDVKLLEIK